VRAIVYDGLGGVDLRDLAVAPVGPGQVRVRTLVTGISAGTETHHLRTRRDGVARIPGYQNVGRVTDVGPGAAGVAVGDRIYTHHWHGAALPPDPELGPVRLSSGAQASERLGPADSADLVPLPAWIPDLPAAFLSVAAIGLHCVRRGGVRPGHRVLVTGLGPVGLSAVQGARLSGATVAGLDRIPFRLARARQVGCETAFDARGERVWEEVAGNGPYDVVIETTGANALMDPILRVVAGERTPAREMVRQGVVVLVGLRPRTEYAFTLAHAKEVLLAHTSHHTRADLDDVLAQWRAGAWSIEPLITHRIPPGAAPAFYRRLSEGPDDVLGVAIDWGESPDTRRRRHVPDGHVAGT
jgi:2-desacetyl-2-hydroxyethyl bacteriochlorophyllide A dehydrogenase